MISLLLAAIIELTGVTGGEMRARSFFDANNVKVGDPMMLTIDFIGEADFHDIHPPALSRYIKRRDWKLDDKSAKTDTYNDARRLTYRIRPRREGVLYFPALEFSYKSETGEELKVRSNEIPVHAVAGEEVVVEGMDESAEDGMPLPPAITSETNLLLTDDESFRWRKALSNPSAVAFSEFDFPEAKMNEATMYIKEGNWSKAMAIYSRLEWQIGQTEEIEKGIIAALALRYENPNAELPVWREVLRPILRYSLIGRVMIVGGMFLGLCVIGLSLNFIIRRLAVFALLVGLPMASMGQGLFQQFNFGFGGKREPVKVEATFEISKLPIKVGEEFEFIVALEYPKTSSVDISNITPSDNFGLSYPKKAELIADGKSENISNVVKRISIPARYDVPFKGQLAFVVNGMVSGKTERSGTNSRFSFTFSNSFSATTKPMVIEVKPLDTAGQPKNFSGIVSEGLRVNEECDLLKVATNDVITITYRMHVKGYVPNMFVPEGMAYEWFRQADLLGHPTMIEYKGYFVAQGERTTPKRTISYFDPRDKKYKSVTVGGTILSYK